MATRVIVVAGGGNAVGCEVDSEGNERDGAGRAGWLPGEERVDSQVLYNYLVSERRPDDSGGWFADNGEGRLDNIGPVCRDGKTQFGCEITLGRKLFRSGCQPLVVVKLAKAGTTLDGDWNSSRPDGLYQLLKRRLEAVMHTLREQNQPPILSGVFWFQGESDRMLANTEQRYYDNLKRFIAGFRRDFNVPQLPFVLSGIYLPEDTEPDPQSSFRMRWEAIVDAQQRVATEDISCRFVDTFGFPLENNNYFLNTKGVEMLGEESAKAFLSLRRF